ncbi:MAG: hypothetical protein NAOJABEB_01669 [Steroidobacteraceae bacterium]|nr:hypothetical protein [Steroidobacteraceae bacterium]
MTAARDDGRETGIMRVQTAVAPLDGFLRSVSRRLEFRRDVAGRIVVIVRDLATGAVIRQSPAPDTQVSHRAAVK